MHKYKAHNQLMRQNLSNIQKSDPQTQTARVKSHQHWLKKFHNDFLYGQQIKILHKGSPKYMTVYLDNNNDKLLWISSKTKAFLIDLYFSRITFEQIEQLQKKSSTIHYFTLRQFSDHVVMIFDDEDTKNRMIKNLNLYIEQLKSKDTKYCAYFSNVAKKIALESTRHGGVFKTQKQILQFSKQVGLKNQVNNQRILKNVTQHYKQNKNSISLECAQDYFKIQFCSQHLKPVFQQYSKAKLGQISLKPTVMLQKVMDRQQFYHFLSKSQHQNPKRIQQIMSNIEGDLSFFDFCLFMYDERYCYITQFQQLDQSYPLNDYFCYSSHNTYLSGNQLTSDSKVSRYTQDLQNGIKCVELDVHNDGDTPIITHAVKGQGFCKPIIFEDVIKAIDRFSQESRENGNNHYPIILSIQNHASQENREKMLNILLKYFNDELYRLDETDADFPSLSKLRGKIVVKTSSKQLQLRDMMKKDGKMAYNTDLGMNLENSLARLQKSQRGFQNPDLNQQYQKFKDFKSNIISQKKQFYQRMDKYQQIFLPVSSMAKVTSIFKAQQGIKTISSSPFQCTSLTNSKVMKTDSQQIIEYSKRSWLRTYPIGTQVGSDNYDPIPMLDVGAQIIALNTQTKDTDAWITHGYFSAGRFCEPGMKGYVLKPQRLLPKGKNIQKKRYKINIDILQGNGYDIKMKFRGLENEMDQNKQNKSQFTVKNMDQAFVVITFDQIYRECVALRFISTGYRVIQVKNRQNYIDTGGRVIVHVNKEQI